MAHSGMGASCDCDNVPLSPQVLPFVNDRGGSLEDLVLPGVPGPSRVAGCAEFQGVWPILGNTATGGSPIHPVGASAAAAGPCPSVPFPPARKPQKLTDGPQVHAGENKAICGSCWPLSLSLSAGSLQVWSLGSCTPPAESRRCRSSCSWGCAVEH